MAQHGVQADCAAVRERDAGLFAPEVLNDLHGPRVEREDVLASGQDRVGRYVEELSNHAVTLLSDPACPVDLTGLVAPQYKSEVSTDIADCCKRPALSAAAYLRTPTLAIVVQSSHACDWLSMPRRRWPIPLICSKSASRIDNNDEKASPRPGMRAACMIR